MFCIAVLQLSPSIKANSPSKIYKPASLVPQLFFKKNSGAYNSEGGSAQKVALGIMGFHIFTSQRNNE